MIGVERRDADIGVNGVEDELHQRSSVGFRFRQATEGVMDEQVAQARLEMLQRSQRMLTASTSEESLQLQNRIAAGVQGLMKVTDVMASAVTRLNQA